MDGGFIDSSEDNTLVDNSFGFNFGGDTKQYLSEIFLWAGVNGNDYGTKIDSVVISGIPNSTKTFTFGYENGTQIFRVDNQTAHTLKYPKTKTGTMQMNFMGGPWQGDVYSFTQSTIAVYQFDIYENDILEYEYKPAKYNNIIGLYDKHHDNFLYPIGGTFKETT